MNTSMISCLHLQICTVTVSPPTASHASFARLHHVTPVLECPLVAGLGGSGAVLACGSPACDMRDRHVHGHADRFMIDAAHFSVSMRPHQKGLHHDDP